MLIAALLMALGAFASKQSLALAARSRSIDFAWRLAPSDARIASAKSENLASRAKTGQDWFLAIETARRALLRDPLSPGAVVTLGLNAGLRGDNHRAEGLFAYSSTITRRDLNTHLWGIEQAVSLGNTTDALRHYDEALRTSRRAPDVLFPVLGAAITDSKIRSALAKILSKPSSQIWGVPFVRLLALTGPDYAAIADLFLQLRSRGTQLPEGVEASVLGALVTSRKYDIAWNYAVRVRPGLSRIRSRDPNFLISSTAPFPFDWNPINDAGLSATIQRADRGGAFTFSAVSGIGGVVLRQLQLLSPGRYKITSRLSELNPQAPSPFWTVQCIDGPEVARVELTKSQSPQRPLSSQFVIGPNCPAQWLSLSISPTDDVGGLSGIVDYAAIVPLA